MVSADPSGSEGPLPLTQMLSSSELSKSCALNLHMLAEPKKVEALM